MKGLSAILRCLSWAAMLCVSTAAYGQAVDRTTVPATNLLPTTQSASPSAQDEAQCFEAVLSQNSDTVWCDVLITRLNQQLPLEPANQATLARVYHNRAVLLIRSGELALADADLTAALKLRPNIPELHLTLGNLRLTQNRFAEALDHYNEAIVLSDGRQPEYFISRALALRGLGQIELAADDIGRSRGEWLEAQPEVSPSGSAGPPGGGFQ
jgi:lipoprotein NlpI